MAFGESAGAGGCAAIPLVDRGGYNGGSAREGFRLLLRNRVPQPLNVHIRVNLISSVRVNTLSWRLISQTPPPNPGWRRLPVPLVCRSRFPYPDRSTLLPHPR